MSNFPIQMIGFAGTVFYFLSYQCKKNRDLFRIQFLSYLCYTVHLILLGAVTGGVSYILNMIRSLCLGSKNDFLKSRTMCRIICGLQAAAMAATWSGWISVLPVAANIAATVGGYTHDGSKIRLSGMLINSPLWIVYDVIVGSWAGILDEVISEISMVISIARYGWNNLEKE